jgi:hypothetical protein
MTYLEKVLKMNEQNGVKRTRTEIIERFCPSDFLSDCSELYEGCDVTKLSVCTKCWNREMPNTEAKVEVIPQAEVDAWHNAHESGKAEGYEQGMNDAWELADKFNNMAMSEIIKVLGIDISRAEVFDAVYPQDALAKLKAYEEAQIEVGDVVYHDAYGNGIMTREDKEHYNVLLENGDAMCFEKESVTKTGKHLDISSILEQIGE